MECILILIDMDENHSIIFMLSRVDSIWSYFSFLKCYGYFGVVVEHSIYFYQTYPFYYLCSTHFLIQFALDSIFYINILMKSKLSLPKKFQ